MCLYLLLCRYVHIRNLSVCLRDRWTLNMLSLRAGLMISLALFCLICSSLHPKVTFVKDCNTYSKFSESVFLLVSVFLLFSYLGVWSSVVLFVYADSSAVWHNVLSLFLFEDPPACDVSNNFTVIFSCFNLLGSWFCLQFLFCDIGRFQKSS